jgi:hypothetical protein
MTERNRGGCLKRMKLFLVNFNLFETNALDEQTISIQRWSTRVYISAMTICMCSLIVQAGIDINTQLIEVKNPTLDEYHSLEKLHEDLHCPCSQIATLYGSFFIVIPIYHRICTSDFISETWIAMIVDNMTAYRYIGDFRATASTQFQALRELCRFSQTTLNKSIQSFLETEFISGVLLNENRWHIEIDSASNAFLDSRYTNGKHKISFLRSFISFNLLIPGIQTAMTLRNYGNEDQLEVLPNIHPFHADVDAAYCRCDEYDTCYVHSAFYNITTYDHGYFLEFWQPETNRILLLKNWSVGCWALQSVLGSSVTSSFLNNQTVLNMVATYLNWPLDVTIPNALNLTSDSTGIVSDLLQTLFTQSIVNSRNYSTYFKQCQVKSCFYSIKEHPSVLYTVTALLSLYGGLSAFLRFLVPRLVLFIAKRLERRKGVDAVGGKCKW